MYSVISLKPALKYKIKFVIRNKFLQFIYGFNLNFIESLTLIKLF